MRVVTPAKEYDIDHCFHCCPYFGRDSECMICNHPSLKTFEEKMIISWTEDIKNGFPSKCPLLKGDLK